MTNMAVAVARGPARIDGPTQHYADFDVQVRAVLGDGKSGKGRFEDVARYLEKLILDSLKP